MNDRRRWLDDPRNVSRLVHGLYVLCAALLLADLLYTKHTHFAFEAWFGFFAFFGFGAYVFIVMSAKLLRRWLKRPEDYYERDRPGAHDD